MTRANPATPDKYGGLSVVMQCTPQAVAESIAFILKKVTAESVYSTRGGPGKVICRVLKAEAKIRNS